MGKRDNMEFFGSALLEWYGRSKRDLPWRRTKDPYRIWVSEVMLQQTRVDTVIPYYERFLDKFPSVQELAEAPEDEVLKMWEGLGYYSRARNLQTAVREVHEQYGGRVPDDPKKISGLRGVGPYTAGAVLSIAYNLPEPAVDGNVMRVLSRFFLIADDIAKPSTRTAMEKLARELIPEGAAGDFNQAIMELGALVCTPRSPHCLTCPLMERCAARRESREEELPVKTKAKPPRPELRAAALIEGSDAHAGKLLLRQRPADGLLARMWELPHVELPPQHGAAGAGGFAPGAELPPAAHAAAMAELRERLAEADGVAAVPLEWRADAEHTFSHLRWHVRVYRCRAADEGAGRSGAVLPPNYRWAAPEELAQYALPNVFLRILREIYGDGVGGTGGGDPEAASV